MNSIREQLPLIPLYSTSTTFIYHGDALNILEMLPSGICQTSVTSPPYWGLRDYEASGQIGSEENVNDYIQKLVQIFHELRRVLMDNGTFWLNLGDCYTSGGRTWRAPDKKNPARAMSYRTPTPIGLKPKDLVGVPWRVAMALQADGWYLRSEIIWNKPNGLPESVKDRPTRSHETIFLFSKNVDYYYNYEAIREKGVNGLLRNKRSVWSIKTEPYKGAHFATFPPRLIEPCILAGSKREDFIIDPFLGSGTTAYVSNLYDRNFLGIELKADYIELTKKRLIEKGMSFDVIEPHERNVNID
jgi:site-specific DNA-methyltransferase (cytosine-N4-specific)